MRDPGTWTPVPPRRTLGPSQPWPACEKAPPRVQAEGPWSPTPSLPPRTRSEAEREAEGTGPRARAAAARRPNSDPRRTLSSCPQGRQTPHGPPRRCQGNRTRCGARLPRPAGSTRPTWLRLRGSGRAMSAPSGPSPYRGLVHLHFCLRGPLGVDQQVIENRLLLAFRCAWNHSRRGLGGRHARQSPSGGGGATTASREGHAAPAAAAFKSQGRGWG